MIMSDFFIQLDDGPRNIFATDLYLFLIIIKYDIFIKRR
jgi:hypothetical protein